MAYKIPMSSPDITPAEIDAVVNVLHTPVLSIGPRIEQFEAEMAQIAGTRFAVGVSSGTAGLHLAVLAAGIGEGDLAITTPFSFIASANCLLYERAVPIFVDVQEPTGNIDPNLVEEAAVMLRKGGAKAKKYLPPALRNKRFAPETLKAMIPVDVFGQAADFDPLRKTAADHGLVVIEDACEAVGAEYKRKPAGSLGDMAVFAFYPNKQMTTAEGGICVTSREDWADLARSLRNQGRAPGSAWLDHARLGYNYRMDELSAALGYAQARRLPELIAKRSRVASWYQDRFGGTEWIRTPGLMPATTKASWFVYVIRILPPMSRDAVIKSLAAEGIPARKYFQPIHLQPFYQERFGFARGDFPVTERLGDESLALPFSSVMTEEQVDLVAKTILSVDRKT